MGFTVYASCYAKSDGSVDLLPQLAGLEGRSLFVADAEPISVIASDGSNLSHMSNIPGYRKVAWCFSKVMFALSPGLAECSFIFRFALLARRLGPSVKIILTDDGDLEHDASAFPRGKLLALFGESLLWTPIWFIKWLTVRVSAIASGRDHK
jgi:hypothetical protein